MECSNFQHFLKKMQKPTPNQENEIQEFNKKISSLDESLEKFVISI